MSTSTNPPTSTPGVDSGSPAGGGDDPIMRLVDKVERAAERRALERVGWQLSILRARNDDASADWREGLLTAMGVVAEFLHELDEVAP